MYQYVVQVHGKAYVWGSANLGITLAEPLILLMNNGMFGESVEVASETPAAAPVVLGNLGPGECWTLALTGLRGVTVTCATDTMLACAIFRAQ